MGVLILNIDCMEYMATCKDKQFDLAIVDPPYGIGISNNPFRQKHNKSDWDEKIPSNQYFKELNRVSKDQIIWGGNYFNLSATQGFIIWDKIQPESFSSSMCEYAWTSIQSPAKIFRLHVVTAETNKIHPTQKPVKLYKWILKNYASPDMKIIDTHLGSGSSAIAACDFGCDFVGCEIDKEYYDAAVKRFETYKMQGKLEFV